MKVLANYSPNVEDVQATPPIPDLKGMARHEFAMLQGEIASAYENLKGFYYMMYGDVEKSFSGGNIGFLTGKFQITKEELFRVLNYVQQTGEVFKGEHFVIYFKNTNTHDGKMYFYYSFIND